MAQGKKEEAEEYKRQVSAQGDTIEKLSVEEKEVEEKIKTIMMTRFQTSLIHLFRLEKMTVKMWS